MRLLFVPVLAFTVSLAACAEEKKSEPRAERLAKLKETSEEISQRYEKAEPEDRKKIRDEAKELFFLNAGRALRIANEEPKDAVALEAAAFALEQLLSFGTAGEDLDKALNIIAEYHLTDPKLRAALLDKRTKRLPPLLAMISQAAGDAGQKFIKTVSEKAADHGVKGMSLYYLGTAAAESADATDDEAKAKELTAQAIDYFENAIKLAGNEKFGREGTLAKTVEEELVGLKTLAIGKPAPDVQATDLKTGDKVKLSNYKGKVVLLDVWATWCGPCKAMIPHEREMVKKLEGKPFQLISVSADDEKSTLEKFIEKTPMPWTHWWDGPESEVLKKYRVHAFPTLYLIDAKGVIRKKFIGAPEGETLDKAIEGLLSQASGK